MTHKELQADLALALRAQKRLVLQEVDLCSRWANVPRIDGKDEDGRYTFTKPGAPRIDVLRVSESYTKFEVFAYECKATRSDFLSDMRNGKWRQYLPYCHRLYFAVDYGVCDATEIPAECGLLMRRKSGKGWQTVKQAPTPAPEHELQWGTDTFLAVLFSIYRQPQPLQEREQRQRNVHSEWREHSKKFGERMAKAISRAETLLDEVDAEDGDNCSRCGARVKPYLYELTADERLAHKSSLLSRDEDAA